MRVKEATGSRLKLVMGDLMKILRSDPDLENITLTTKLVDGSVFGKVLSKGKVVSL